MGFKRDTETVFSKKLIRRVINAIGQKSKSQHSETLRHSGPNATHRPHVSGSEENSDPESKWELLSYKSLRINPAARLCL